MAGAGALRLNLGCFDHPVRGWVNGDITPHVWVARVPGLARFLFRVGRISEERFLQHQQGIFRHVRYVNVARRLPFHDSSVDAIYSSHLLEHLPRQAARRFLSESYRVLRPEGVIRTAVPDLDAIIEQYTGDEPDQWLVAFLEADQIRDKNRHHWHYNEKSLRVVLTEAGFTNVRRYGFKEGHCPDIDLLDHRPDSLFMEALKGPG